MNAIQKAAFKDSMQHGKAAYHARDFAAAYRYLEDAHIIGQQKYVSHLLSHYWMFKVGLCTLDAREVAGQIFRMAASVGSLVGVLPLGNNGRARISPFKPMPLPDHLKPLFKS